MKKILKKIIMRDVASYDSAGTEIDNLKAINFLYGANGSGKTTISRYLDSLGKAEKEDQFLSCSVEEETLDVDKIIVYNKDFRDRHFGQGKFPGIFSLGPRIKEDQDNINKIEEELRKVRDYRESVEKNKKELEKGLHEKNKSISR